MTTQYIFISRLCLQVTIYLRHDMIEPATSPALSCAPQERGIHQHILQSNTSFCGQIQRRYYSMAAAVQQVAKQSAMPLGAVHALKESMSLAAMREGLQRSRNSLIPLHPDDGYRHQTAATL